MRLRAAWAVAAKVLLATAAAFVFALFFLVDPAVRVGSALFAYSPGDAQQLAVDGLVIALVEALLIVAVGCAAMAARPPSDE